MAGDKKIFTLGADPEFCCVDGRELVESSCHANDFDQFGCDGDGITFEVRPEPSTNPLEIVSSIHDIFVRKLMSAPIFHRFTWKAGSYYADRALGGHIHFGIKNTIYPTNMALSILDNYLGSISILLENTKQGIKRRVHGHYGRMGDFRNQDHGFEYRTCASWLTSPYIAAALLCLGKILMYEALNNPKFTPKTYVVADDFNAMNVDKIRKSFPEIWKEITQMALYQHYKPYVDLIYFIVTKKLSWFPQVPMKEAWGLFQPEIIDSGKVKLDMIWYKFNNHAIDLSNQPVEVAVE
jgi:hypothetical protein